MFVMKGKCSLMAKSDRNESITKNITYYVGLLIGGDYVNRYRRSMKQPLKKTSKPSKVAMKMYTYMDFQIYINMITILWSLIILIKAQNARFEEIIVLAPFHYIQIGQVTGSTSQELFNAGTLTVELELILNETINYPGTSFSLALFNVGDSNKTISRNYECLIDSLLYTPKINYTEKICNITFSPCPQNMIQGNEMLYTNCNSTTNAKFTFYQEDFNKLVNSEQILVIINQNLVPISFLSSYSVDVKHRFSFYNLSLGLCIALGIVLILLLSLLCVLNYKYEKVKEENVRLNLVKGT